MIPQQSYVGRGGGGNSCAGVIESVEVDERDLEKARMLDCRRHDAGLAGDGRKAVLFGAQRWIGA